MDVKHRELLTSNLELIVSSLQLNDELKCKLIQENVFTSPMLEDILAKQTERAKKELILELRTRGPFAFEKFVTILGDIGQGEVAEVLVGRKAPYPFKTVQEHRKHAANEGPEQLVVRKAKEPITGEKIFKMTSKPRGKCLIINNMHFGDVKKYRVGSDTDAMKLDMIFQQLGYVVILERDQDAKQMEELFKKFSKDPEHKYMDSCVVIILSHGQSSVICGIDSEEVYTEDILRFFNNQNCPGLKGKPKMFFFQACRGIKSDIGVDKIESADCIVRMPTYSDMLIAYSTVEGYISIRDPNFGSWFCQELVYALIEDACDTDLESILKRVDEKVQGRMTREGKKQSTEIVCRGWHKTLYFNPGFYDLQK